MGTNWQRKHKGDITMRCWSTAKGTATAVKIFDDAVLFWKYLPGKSDWVCCGEQSAGKDAIWIGIGSGSIAVHIRGEDCMRWKMIGRMVYIQWTDENLWRNRDYKNSMWWIVVSWSNAMDHETWHWLFCSYLTFACVVLLCARFVHEFIKVVRSGPEVGQKWTRNGQNNSSDTSD